MELMSQSPQPINNKSKIILAVNLLLGLLLCFGILTGYSWNNEWANLIFPLIVGTVGIVTLFSKKKTDIFGKHVDSIFYIPSILIGVPYILSTILLISMSLFFASGIFVDERVNEIIIQQEFPHDGRKIAQVECFPAVAHGGHSIRIHIVYQALPFVKRGLTQYWEMSSCEKIDDDNYVSWLDNGTVYLLKEQKELQVNPIGWNNLFEFNLEK